MVLMLKKGINCFIKENNFLTLEPKKLEGNEKIGEFVCKDLGKKLLVINGKWEDNDLFKLYRVKLWDLSGQDNILKIIKIYAKDAHGCIIFSDSTNIQTRKDSIKWKQYVDESASFFNDGKLPCILVESKSDLLKKNENYEEEIKKFAEENGFDGGFTVSSKEGININESFEFLMNTIIERMELMLKKGINCFIKENNFNW